MTFSSTIWSCYCDLTNNCLVQVFFTYAVWVVLVWIIRQLIFWRLWICWWDCRSLVFNFDNYSINTIWSSLFSLRNILTIDNLPACWCNWINNYIFISLTSQWSSSYFSISLIVNVRNLTFLIVWNIVNYNLRINIVRCYLVYCFYTSLTWSITSYFWSSYFNKAASSPRVVRNFFSYFIVSTSSC